MLVVIKIKIHVVHCIILLRSRLRAVYWLRLHESIKL